MGRRCFFFIIFFLAMCSEVVVRGAGGEAASGSAPSPAMDCSNAMLSMSDCLGFVQQGSKAAKPKGTCCSALKRVVKTQAECLCQAFRSSGQYGLSINMTKALSLPSACKVSTPSVTTCNRAAGPGAAPAPSPGGFSTNAPASSPSSSRGVPAPSPIVSGGHALSVPKTIVFLFLCVLRAY